MSAFGNNDGNNMFAPENLVGLPGGDDFNLDGVFDFTQPLNMPQEQRNGSKDSFTAFLESGAPYNGSEQPQYDANMGDFTDFSQIDGSNNNFVMPQDTMTQTQNIDPALLYQTNEEQPRYRTDSGSEIPAIRGINGEWLHPRNGRVLDERELRWDSGIPMTAALPSYDVPQSSTFDPMLNPGPMQMGTQYQYPDPTSFAPVHYAQMPEPMPETPVDTGMLSNVLPTIEEDTDEQQITFSSRRKSSGRGQGSKINRRQPLYHVEAPKTDDKRPWVRVNSATKGNTRTGKTNTYGDGPYQNTLHPFGVSHPQWTASNGTTFRYNQWGELNSVAFNAQDLECFLYEHPFHNAATRATLPAEQQNAIIQSKAKLVLWIQKMPGDSAKRVNTQHGLKCRVRECPAGIYKARTINTGHYRVAFDEQWSTYGDTRNPMHVAGYAHLYCMERFLNFAKICRDLGVRADDRQIPGEPTGEWIAGLGQGTDEFKVAKDFITATKTGKGAERWTSYPDHDPRHPEKRKLPHDRTLVYRLVDRKAAATGHSKMRMMQARGRTATQFFVNMGDLQMQIDAQQERNASRAQKTKGRATLKRKMVDEEEEEEAQESSGEGDESDGADNGDPDGDYVPRARKRSKRASAINPRKNSYAAADSRQATGAERSRVASRGSMASDVRRLRSSVSQAPTAYMMNGSSNAPMAHDEELFSPKSGLR
ncbi:MAG: hypothetical protein Q9159_002981 [Coniocarpon cinnabarinum]